MNSIWNSNVPTIRGDSGPAAVFPGILAIAAAQQSGDLSMELDLLHSPDETPGGRFGLVSGERGPVASAEVWRPPVPKCVAVLSDGPNQEIQY